MKYKFGWNYYVVAILVLCSLAIAGLEPHPIYGTITSGGFPLENVKLTVTDKNTGDLEITTTDSKGKYQVELPNFSPYWRNGDTIIVTIDYCKNLPECSKTAIVSGGNNLISFDIRDISTLPEEVIIVKYVCWNEQSVENQTDCPIQPPVVVEVPILKIECADGSVVAYEVGCPEQKDSFIYWVIGILCVLFGLGAGGWKFYGGKFKHYHKGIVGYHDPNTSHSNTKYRHKLWKESALGCISDVKKIQQGVDLSLK